MLGISLTFPWARLRLIGRTEVAAGSHGLPMRASGLCVDGHGIGPVKKSLCAGL